VARGSVVVLVGRVRGDTWKRNNRKRRDLGVLRYDSAEKKATFKDLPPLSCGPIREFLALAIDESESGRGRVDRRTRREWEMVVGGAQG
jgi:hypothetical protein